MPTALVVIHERLGNWHRQLKARLTGPNSPRFVASRSADSLVKAVSGVAVPIVVIDLADRPGEMLADLVEAVNYAPEGFYLILNPNQHPGVKRLAREFGATFVVSGWAPPPAITAMVERWLPLAGLRTERDGWSVPVGPEPEVWEQFDGLATIAAPFAPEVSDS